MLDSQLQEDHILRYTVSFEDNIDSKNQMAVVTFFDENNKKVTKLKLKVIVKEKIYDLLDNAADINLQNSYIKDFSLTEYRELRNKNTEEYILLQNFNAVNTFFDCDAITDLSYSKFEGSSTIFNNCVFL